MSSQPAHFTASPDEPHAQASINVNSPHQYDVDQTAPVEHGDPTYGSPSACEIRTDALTAYTVEDARNLSKRGFCDPPPAYSCECRPSTGSPASNPQNGEGETHLSTGGRFAERQCQTGLEEQSTEIEFEAPAYQEKGAKSAKTQSAGPLELDYGTYAILQAIKRQGFLSFIPDTAQSDLFDILSESTAWSKAKSRAKEWFANTFNRPNRDRPYTMWPSIPRSCLSESSREQADVVEDLMVPLIAASQERARSGSELLKTLSARLFEEHTEGLETVHKPFAWDALQGISVGLSSFGCVHLADTALSRGTTCRQLLSDLQRDPGSLVKLLQESPEEEWNFFAHRALITQAQELRAEFLRRARQQAKVDPEASQYLSSLERCIAASSQNNPSRQTSSRGLVAVEQQISVCMDAAGGAYEAYLRARQKELSIISRIGTAFTSADESVRQSFIEAAGKRLSDTGGGNPTRRTELR